MQQLWVLEATAVMQPADNKVELLMVQTFYSAVMYGAEGVERPEVDKMSAVVKKALRSIIASSETALLTFCRTTGYFHPVCSLMLPNVLARCRTGGRWPRGAAILIRGSRGVGRLRLARTGAVMSNPLLSRSSTP
jgi:hypothetical protein